MTENQPRPGRPLVLPGVRRALPGLARMALLPAAFYFVAFWLLIYPWLQPGSTPQILLFSTRLYGDQGDALQCFWNFWWLDRALVQLGQSPWYTTALHYPYGISLIGHVLNPLHGLMGIVLLRFFTLIETYNFIVVFAFVASGVTAFGLAYEITQSYAGSLLAGYIYTFSSYHFLHAGGHLHIVTFEFIPLFMLVWHRLLDRPSLARASAAAVLLLAVTLVTYYHLLYCALAAAILVAWRAWRARDAFFFWRKPYRLPLLAFAGLAAATTGLLVLAFAYQERVDPLLGAHPAVAGGLDLQALFVPGGRSRFGALTEPVWSRWSGNINESGANLGVTTALLAIYAWRRRRHWASRDLTVWYVVLLCFVVLSFGPVLRFGGSAVPLPVPMPYAALEAVVPLVSASGIPERMMAMALLAAGVIGAAGFEQLRRAGGKARWVAALVCLGVFLEYFSYPIVMSDIAVPPYVYALKMLPAGQGAVYLGDFGPQNVTLSLYYQTIHEKPLAFGYLARVPASTARQDAELQALLAEHAPGFLDVLYRRYGLRYLIAGAAASYPGQAVVYQDASVRIYDLAQGAARLGRRERTAVPAPPVEAP
jgi:hypothetical protein